MANLYFTPTSCGAASFIAAHRAGILNTPKLAANLVDIRAHKVLSGAKKGSDFYAINPKGNVPALVLEDGTLLNEGAATLQWIADQSPDSGLAPPNGTSARYVLQAKLNYVASEVHASVSPLFNPSLNDEQKKFFVNKVNTKLDYLSRNELKAGKFLLGNDTFTIADSYLYICLSWFPYLKLSVEEYPVIKAFSEKAGALDFVKEAHAAMDKIVSESS